MSVGTRMSEHSGVLSNWWGARKLAAEPSLVSRIHSLRRWEASLPQGELRRDVHELLNRAEQAISRVPGIPTAYDAVWRALHEVRHRQCLQHDLLQQQLVAAEIRADVEYHRDKHALLRELDTVVAHLPNPAAWGETSESLAARLLRLSTLAAEEREAAWRKTNRIMRRRRETSRWLWVAAGLLIVALPWAMNADIERDAYVAEVGAYALVGLCGAIGGLLSGLLNQDRTELSSLEHHLEQFALRLRPCVGAIAALILRLFVLAGAINISDSQGLSAELLLLAIAAGFSERLVIKQIERIGIAKLGTDEAGEAKQHV